MVINTHRGLFRYKRLPFGVASAPAILQRAIEGVMRCIPHTSVYIDHILVIGQSEEEHLLGNCRTTTEAGQMCHFAIVYWVLRAQDFVRGITTHTGEGTCHCQGPSSSKCIPVTFISGTGELLCYSFPAPCHHYTGCWRSGRNGLGEQPKIGLS